MAAKSSKAATNKTARKKTARGARKRLTPASSQRGLETGEALLSIEAPEVSGLVETIRSAGGTPLAAYREPLSGHPMSRSSPLHLVATADDRQPRSPCTLQVSAARSLGGTESTR
jgi:hypothetical protein